MQHIIKIDNSLYVAEENIIGIINTNIETTDGIIWGEEALPYDLDFNFSNEFINSLVVIDNNSSVVLSSSSINVTSKVQIPLVHIGHGNYIARNRILQLYDMRDEESFFDERRYSVILDFSSLLIDATNGKKDKTLILLNNRYAIISSIASLTLEERINVTT